ncbi:hypothetical protein [Limnobacter parvus]|uniref:hypothetical protein n=1 Tax=Limnobacter parvus TaxID=2939690 RepID=UPI00214BE678|nr:hypothetical protein [Limnobacter parvus]
MQDLALPDLSSPSDSWTEGARQKELNERGAYIHRFKDQSSLNSMIAAVKKISEDNICTPCTLVGPSLCRSYNHYVWEGCAALLFSPAMNIVLSYKGDIYSDRLKNEPNLSHSNFKSGQAGRKESLELFSDAVRSKFNGYAATSSAFKGRRTKKLNLVVSASHHVAKTQEMEKRANLYFIPPEDFPAINLDVSSKYLILDLCERYSDYQLPCKPVLQTKAQVLEFIDTVTQINPSLLPFLRAARIKISTFKDDSVVHLYFENAKHASNKQSHESSYADFMKWQFKNSQTGSNLLTHSDKSTTLTPNEVLGMPSTEDLVGLLIDPSTSKSFDQALATLKHLRESRTSNWASVAQSVPPFTHLISHLDHGTLIQLGWSKMIIPYSTEGLTEYCTTGKITAIDGYKFGPDYFLLLHRIASNSILVFSKEHRTVDLLFVKPNVISNFSSILSGGGKTLLFEAVEQGNIHTETLRLFCHLDRLGTGNFSRVREAHENPHANPRHKSTLEKLIILDDQKADEDLKNLLTAQINRIERSAFRKCGDHRTVKYRAGFEDQGIFEFNPSLGSLSLTEGVRKFDNGTRLIGVFKPDSDMKRGGG